MEQEKVIDVIFRKEEDRNNNIIAVFSKKFSQSRKDKLMFSFIDGHCAINHDYYIESTKRCTNEDEYRVLKECLENQYGYKLKIVPSLHW